MGGENHRLKKRRGRGGEVGSAINIPLHEGEKKKKKRVEYLFNRSREGNWEVYFLAGRRPKRGKESLSFLYGGEGGRGGGTPPSFSPSSSSR